MPLPDEIEYVYPTKFSVVVLLADYLVHRRATQCVSCVLQV
jgi:hypothetical protein